MKTSNKLLLGLLLFFLAGILSLALAARMLLHVTPHEISGKIVSETRPITDFTKINVNGRLKVYITQGAGPEVRLRGDEVLLAKVETTIQNHELQIRLYLRNARKRDSVAVYIRLDTLERLGFGAGSVVQTVHQIKGDELEVRASSGSIGELNLNYPSTVFEASSGANLRLKGEAKVAEFNFSSGSIIRALDFKVAECIATGSSGAIAKLFVTKNLDVTASSGAVLQYDGGCQVKLVKINSGAVVEQKLTVMK